MSAIIEHMVNRFLTWNLPADFAPDGGISFNHIEASQPTGTNLFTATQAKAMIAHMLEGLPDFETANKRLEAKVAEYENTKSAQEFVATGVAMLCRLSHDASRAAGWYSNSDGSPKERNVPEMLCLIHSEISEAMEGFRKSLPDDKLPHRPMIEVELADTAIRIGDLAGYLKLDVAGAIIEKMGFNRTRADHKLENRNKAGGKAF